jgi:hypothetical protein
LLPLRLLLWCRRSCRLLLVLLSRLRLRPRVLLLWMVLLIGRPFLPGKGRNDESEQQHRKGCAGNP